MSIKRQKSVKESSRWNFVGYGAEAVIRLSSNLILVRIVAPEAFGLIGLVTVVTIGFSLLSDAGLQPSVVRSARGDEKVFLSTVWTIQVVRGFLLFALMCVAAGFIAEFYEKPELKNLILLLALVAIVDGFTSVGVHVATRHLDLKPVVILEVLTHAVAFATVIVVASIRGDVWALAIGSVVSRTARAFLSHLLFRQDNVGFGWDRTAFRELLGFGKWIMLATALTFAAFQIDRIMLAKYVTWAELGVYSVLIAWAEIPRVAMMKWASQVYYPQISRWYRVKESFVAKTESLRGVMLSITSLPMGIAIGLAGPWINFIYPEPYASSGHLLVIMFIGMWVESLDILYHQGFLTVNRPQIRSIGMAASTIIFICLMDPVHSNFGLVGVAWLTVFCRFCRLQVQWFFARQESMLFLRQDIIHSAVVAIIAGLAFVLVRTLSQLTSDIFALLLLTFAAAIAAVFWLKLYWPRLSHGETTPAS